MIELSDEMPFLWRLSPESSDGYCSVSVVVACPPETEIKDLTIETNVLSLSSGDTRSEVEETLEWNHEDVNLFLRLINQRQSLNDEPLTEMVRIDLTDPDIIDIIHIVAAAGFGVAFTSGGLLNSSDATFPLSNCEIGSFASLDTIGGFVSCVIVDMEDDDIVCVLLDDINEKSGGHSERVYRHDLLLVKRIDLFQPEYAENRKRPNTAILH